MYSRKQSEKRTIGQFLCNLSTGTEKNKIRRNCIKKIINAPCLSYSIESESERERGEKGEGERKRALKLYIYI